MTCENCIHFEVCSYVSHQLPPCDSYAEPVKHSRWVKDHDGDEYCENCARYMPASEVTGDPSATNYCPNCGAKMHEEG